MNKIFAILLTLISWTMTAQSDSLNPIDSLPEPDSVLLDVAATDSVIPEVIRDIEVEFVKEHVVNSADSTYFNICKVTNTTSRPISGEFQLHFAPNWKMFGAEIQKLTLQPGETKIFPIRLSLPSGVIGGTAYVIDGTFTYNEGISSGVAYVQVPLKAKWDMKVDESTLYFNEYFESVEFEIMLSNEGNAEELINLNFRVGKLLNVIELNEMSIYVPLEAYSDTVIKFTVLRNTEIQEDEKDLLKNNWSASVVAVSAKTSHSEKSLRKSIWIRDLDNMTIINRMERATPLNVDLSVFNLLSTTSPRIQTRLYGEIQFKGDQDLFYTGSLNNLFYNGSSFKTVFNNPYNSTFSFDYRYKNKFKVRLGDIYPRSMHSIRGWGVTGTYFINKTDYVEASYLIGKFYRSNLVNINGFKQIKKVPLKLGFTYEDNKFLHYKAFSLEAGSSVSFGKHHSARGTLLGTFMGLDMSQGLSTPNISNFYGLSYSLGYVTRYDKFTASIRTNNHQFNMLRYRANNTIGGTARYLIDKVSDVSGYVNFNGIGPTRNPFSDSITLNNFFYRNGVARVTYNRRLNNNLNMQVGPTLRILNRYNKNDSSLLNFSNSFYGAYGLIRYKLADNRYISVNSTIGASTFKDHLIDTLKYPALLNWSVSASISDRNWGGSASYYFGPNFFVNNDFFLFSGLNVETISMRAHHTKRFLQNKLKVNSYVTYYLQLPSDRQTFVLSGRGDLELKQMWSTFASFNLYTNSTDNEDFGVVNHRNFALHVGVHKSFDIPQPRIKYHDLEIVCFNDLDGDGERGDNEPLLSNIMANIQKKEFKDFGFNELELVTNTEGKINIIDIPEGDYRLEFKALFNLERLFNLNGDVQNVTVTEDMVLYIPYVESYKVKGSVVLIRDEYSSNGMINVGGIRITAYTEGNQTYSALTDEDGRYVLSVPQAGLYRIRVNNIFGEEFHIDKEEFLIQFNGLKTFNVDFKFFEGKRKVNMDGDSFFNFNLNSNDVDDNSGSNNIPETIEPIEVADELMQKKDDLNFIIDAVSDGNITSIVEDIDPTKVKFMVELGVYAGDVPVDVANKLIELGVVPTPIESAGVTIYATQVVDTHDEVVKLHKLIVDTGFNQALIVGSYDGKVISEKKAIAFKNK